jgi:hypothetical protein
MTLEDDHEQWAGKDFDGWDNDVFEVTIPTGREGGKP